MGLRRFFIFPSCPKQNGRNERFNRTLRYGFVQANEHFADDLPAFNRQLAAWLIWYNAQKPHRALAGNTPLNFLHSQLKNGQLLWTPTNTWRRGKGIDIIRAMMQATLNPYQLPQNLFPAEEIFVNYLRAGRREEQCCVGTGELPEKSVESDDPNVANVVRSEVICFFAYGGDENNPVKGAFIRLQGAWIRGELDLAHAQIPYALIFHNCHFDSVVNMRHAECRELDLQGSCMQEGLTGDPLWTKGGVRFSKGFVAKKSVWLSSACIGGVLDCSNGEFCGGLDANKAKMEVLVWREVTGGEEIHLKAAKADVLEDDLDSWKPFKVDLDGFTYNQFVGQTDAVFRLRWLDNRPDSMEFSPLPYEQAAKVLFWMGHDSDARKILLEKERLQTADARTPLLRKIGREFWDIFAGYGYRLRRTAYWVAGFVGLGALLFSCADYYGRMAPHQPVVLAHQDYNVAVGRAEGKNKCPKAKRPTEVVACLFPEYPEFHPLVYSADVFIPFFALHQEPYWYPNPSDDDRDLSMRFLLWWYWIEIAAGWLLTSLFLLSVTGLLRPR